MVKNKPLWKQLPDWYKSLKTGDADRKKRITIIVLLISIGLTASSSLIEIMNHGPLGNSPGYPLAHKLTLTGIFSALLVVASLGKRKAATIGMIIVYLMTAFGAFSIWGAEIPNGWTMLALIIVISGLLINSKSALIMTVAMGAASYPLIRLYLIVMYGGTTEHPVNWIIIAKGSILLLAIAGVSWLANHETESALEKALNTERQLQLERDNLEREVVKRMAQLRKQQIEQNIQLHRFAEFGRLASGAFHDVSTPLTTIILNLDLIKESDRSGLLTANKNLRDAQKAALRIESFIQSARKQLQQQGNTTELFSLKREIGQAIEILSHKALKEQVKIRFLPAPDTQVYGNSISFSRLVLNLLSNAIDAYEECSDKKLPKQVHISLNETGNKAILRIQDWGCGIPEADTSKIFEPFYTTKDIAHGTGLGLVQVKHAVEQEFNGSISVESKPNEGSLFTITIPLQDDHSTNESSVKNKIS